MTKKGYLIAFLCIISTAMCATAQSTWNGLRFGMSVKEAQEAMASKGVVMLASDPQTLKSDGNYLLRLGEGAKGFPLALTLQFDGGGLKVVSMQLDIQQYKKETLSSTTSDSTAAWTFGSILYDQLRTKYGTPLKEEGDCNAIPMPSTGLSGCEANWRGDKQMITLITTYSAQYNSALIQYEKQSDIL